MDNETYFRNILDAYQKSSQHSDQLYANIGRRLNRKLFGRVADFGNGGIINYDTDRLDKLVCVDVVYTSDTRRGEKIEFRYGDFYDLKIDETFDCCLAQFLLHHLPDDRQLVLSLTKLRSILRPGGKFIILEIVVPPLFEVLQNLTRPLFFQLLTLMRKPGLRFFSTATLEKLLITAGFCEIRSEAVALGSVISPAPVFLPSLKIPTTLYPFRCMLFEAC